MRRTVPELLIWSFLVMLCVSVCHAGAQFSGRATCYRAAGPIEIDGRLDEAAAAPAAPLGPFRHNATAEPCEYPAEARLLWDEEYLYLSLAVEQCHQLSD